MVGARSACQSRESSIALALGITTGAIFRYITISITITIIAAAVFVTIIAVLCPVNTLLPDLIFFTTAGPLRSPTFLYLPRILGIIISSAGVALIAHVLVLLPRIVTSPAVLPRHVTTSVTLTVLHKYTLWLYISLIVIYAAPVSSTIVVIVAEHESANLTSTKLFVIVAIRALTDSTPTECVCPGNHIAIT